MAPSSRCGRRTEPVVLAPAGLEGRLDVPDRATAAIIVAQGSDAGPRLRQIAEALHQAGFATLLCDLLTETEATDWRMVSDIALLAHRLEAVVHCVTSHAATAGLPVGLFGAGTGAAAALVTAAERPASVRAVVACDGRPDLAGEPHLRNVTAPSLLIVGSADREALALNERARSWMTCPAGLAVVPGPTHPVAEAGAMPQEARLAVDWFRRCLAPEPEPDR